MDDLLIRGALMIDGSDSPGREADVVVAGGRIVAVEPRCARPARRVIDARGRVAAPDFIDIHTHSDFFLPLNPRAESKIRQDVTTEVIGNCGYSAAPALPGKVEKLAEYLAASAPWLPFFEATFAQYLDRFPATSVNVMRVHPGRDRSFEPRGSGASCTLTPFRRRAARGRAPPPPSRIPEQVTVSLRRRLRFPRLTLKAGQGDPWLECIGRRS